jgi:hypothetical protein
MTKKARWWGGMGLCVAAALGWLNAGTMTVEGQSKTKDDALERTRKQVRMLDDIYKNAVVLITDKYVHKEDDFSAGSAAVALFAVMKEKGWHEARLLDATGEPYNEKNSPKDDFEKAAIKALKSGKNYHEQVAEVDGKRYLKAATPIPVVSKKCTMCHPHYAQVKEGQAIGALGYTIPIE